MLSASWLQMERKENVCYSEGLRRMKGSFILEVLQQDCGQTGRIHLFPARPGDNRTLSLGRPVRWAEFVLRRTYNEVIIQPVCPFQKEDNEE